MVEIITKTDRLGKSDRFGGSSLKGEIVAKGVCSFCDKNVAFRQVGTYESGDDLYPTHKIQGVDDIPDPIDQYYQEALNCLSVEAPNGAVTLFRKTIHAIAIHYDIAEVNESMGIYEMVNKLHGEGEINEKLRKSLLAVKDLGNDSAHINENEPDMSQAMAIKDLIDAVLSATIIVDQRIEYARKKHPNEFAENSNSE